MFQEETRQFTTSYTFILFLNYSLNSVIFLVSFSAIKKMLDTDTDTRVCVACFRYSVLRTPYVPGNTPIKYGRWYPPRRYSDGLQSRGECD